MTLPATFGVSDAASTVPRRFSHEARPPLSHHPAKRATGERASGTRHKPNSPAGIAPPGGHSHNYAAASSSRSSAFASTIRRKLQVVWLDHCIDRPSNRDALHASIVGLPDPLIADLQRSFFGDPRPLAVVLPAQPNSIAIHVCSLRKSVPNKISALLNRITIFLLTVARRPRIVSRSPVAKKA